MVTSCVRRLPRDTFITIRASYVKICNGNVTAAALISFFENWHNYKLQTIREWKSSKKEGQPPNTWQHHTGKDLEKGIMGLGKRHSIDMAKQQLVSMGVIIIGRNPDYRFAFDATLHFQFQPDRVSELIGFVENSKTSEDVEIDIPEYAENDTTGDAENGAAIPEDSTKKTTSKGSAAGAAAAGGKKSRDRKKQAGPDQDWQRWVDRYEEHVKANNNGIGHNWRDKSQLGDNGLKGIRQHLVNVAVKVEGKSEDDCGFGAWCYILDNWQNLNDEFLQREFDLTVIRKKITNIINRLKNGGSKASERHHQGAQHGTGTSERREAARSDY